MRDSHRFIRRDPRYELEPGSAIVEFTDPVSAEGRVRAELLRISAAGVCFETGSLGRQMAAGEVLADVEISIADRSLPGVVQVLNVHPKDGGGAVYGGLFYPNSPEIEDVLMGLLQVIELTQRVEARR